MNTSGSEPLIVLRDVSRSFVLRQPSQSLLSLLARRSRDDNEFWALRGIDLTVAHGARVGIVGRNGAGKSTLLKIIAGVLQPTSGKISIRGRVDALMSLGMGFHPELTGRQNVVGSLAYRGITGRLAEKYADEIIEFAELEEFAEAALKTYSSGMSARLGFATATAIEPEILIIDEVLGAGDAYFASKSFDRMRRLTQTGATVLFVSHDIGSVEKLCTEAIWLERGQIRQSGDIAPVSRAYAKQIREQELLRLRARNSMISVKNFKALRSRRDRPFQLITRIVTASADEVAASECALRHESGEVLSSVNIGHPQDTTVGEDAAVLIDPFIGQWSRPLNNVETTFHRSLRGKREGELSGAVYFNISMLEPDTSWSISWTLRGAPCRVEVFDGEKYVEIGRFEGRLSFVPLTLPIPKSLVRDYLRSEGIAEAADDGKEAGDPGAVPDAHTAEAAAPDAESGHVSLNFVRFEDSDGQQCHLFQSFDKMRVRIGYRAKRDLHGAVFVVCFYREGVCAFQSLSDMSLGHATNMPAGTTGEALLTVPRLPLGRGHYLVSVAVFPQSIHENRSGDHIAYVLLDRRFQIRVEQPEGGLIDLGIARGDTQWEVAECEQTPEHVTAASGTT